LTRYFTLPRIGWQRNLRRGEYRDRNPGAGSLIEEHQDLGPRRGVEQLPKMDALGGLLFQVVGQELPGVPASRVRG
jgi:hypothetical protein